MQQSTRTGPCVVPRSFLQAGFGEEANTSALPNCSGSQHEYPGSQHTSARPAANEKASGEDTANNRTSTATIKAATSVNGSVDFRPSHQHRDSTSTSASDSTDSSPTTTISTLDSASMTEPSPGPSPESPASAISPTFNDAQRLRLGDRGKTGSSQSPFFEMQRPTTPAKKPRNLKNLAVNTATASVNLGRAISTAHPSLRRNADSTTSAPPSPSFIKPITPPRRKQPSLNLIIETTQGGGMPPQLAVPPTPSLTGPSQLRHFQSSPALRRQPMTLSPEVTRRPSLHSQQTSKSSFSGLSMDNLQEEPAPVGEERLEDDEPNFDVPQSREEKPESYPDGPIKIYDTGVYLFYEPTAEEASQFDVIFNVASEVKNPFTLSAEDRSSSRRIAKVTCDSKIDLGLPQTDVPYLSPAKTSSPSVSLDTSIDSQAAGQENSPTTPKATPLPEVTPSLPSESSKPTPEYIHIPWEHNADIVKDLLRLVKVIDERIQKGKRVLVHCQCGVSRSASLIVAYGLYKNPGISVQDAYDAVKRRSKWIGPNMNLIMQLQEFRNAMLNDLASSKTYRTPGFLSSSDSLTTNFTANLSSDTLMPRTAPLPPQQPGPPSFRSSTGSIPPSPGPLSAPPAWTPGSRSSWDVGQSAPPDIPPQTTSLGPEASSAMKVTDHADRSSRSNESEPSTQQDSVLISEKPKRAPVPNFSRQLPLRVANDADSSTARTSLPRELPSINQQLMPSDRLADTGVKSPVKPEFSFESATSNHTGFTELVSPRRAEFGMVPLLTKPPTAYAHNPLSSPITSAFPSDVLSQSRQESVATAFAQPSRGLSGALPFRNPPLIQEQAPPFPTRAAPPPPLPESPETADVRSTTPKPSTQHGSPSGLDSPPRQKLRTKFSMPDMQTQRRLQRYQADLEVKLITSKSSFSDLRQRDDRSKDDMDDVMASPLLRDEEVLLSPRVSEFTKNPFHDPSVPLPGVSRPIDEETKSSPSSPNSSFGSSTNSRPMEAPVGQIQNTTPEPADPRSPAVTGVTPITRNIFDVL